jgi:putative transposase
VFGHERIYRSMDRGQLNGDPVAGAGWLRRDWLLSAFGGTEQEAVARYRRFVADGKSLASPWGLLKHQVFLGSEAFVEGVRRALPPDRDLSEVPRVQRRSPAKPLGEYAKRYPDRNGAITAAYASGGYTLKEIGQYFGLHYAHVSRVISWARKARYKP